MNLAHTREVSLLTRLPVFFASCQERMGEFRPRENLRWMRQGAWLRLQFPAVIRV
jgi:hypothetical protein